MFLHFFSAWDLWASLTDFGETLPCDLNHVLFYNLGPKSWGSSKKNWDQKCGKFGAISDNFTLQSRISQQRIKILKIGKTWDGRQSRLRLSKKSGELWSTNNKVGHASLDQLKWTFSEDHISAPRGVTAGSSNFYVENGQGLLTYTPSDMGVPNNF